jgi:DNA-binding CsgD family transcriptional regulator
VIHGLYHLVTALCDRSPLAICVDDFDLADRPSRQFVDHLAVRIAELPVLAVLTCRSGNAAPAGSETVRLAPLRPDEVATLAHRRLDGSVTTAIAETVHEATGGNPYLVTELLAELAAERGDADTVRDLVPLSVMRSVRRRLSELPAAAGALAHAAAVLGEEAGMADATAMAGLGAREAAAAVDALVAADLLAPGRPLRFLHPTLRAAVQAALPQAERSALHVRAVGHLAAIPGQTRAAADQAMAADPQGDPVIVTVLRRAAAEARARGRHAMATAYLRRAIEEPPPPAVRPAILLELADAAFIAGDPAALEMADAALGAARDPDGRVTAAILVGHLLTLRNRPGEACRTLMEAIAAEGGSPQLAADAEGVMLIWAASNVAARLETLDRAGEVVRFACRDIDATAPVVAAVASLFAALGDGTAGEAAGLARRALASGGLLDPSGAAGSLLQLPTIALITARQPAAAERGATDLLIHAAAHGGHAAAYLAYTLRGWARLLLGDLTGARSDVAAARDAGRGGGIGMIVHPLGVAVEGWLLLEMGQVAEAHSAVDALAGGARDPGLVSAARWYEVRARLCMAEGRFDDALADLHVCATWEREWRGHTGAWTEWRTLAARCHAALGRPAAGLALLAEARELAAGFGAQALVGLVAHATALIDPQADRPAQLRRAVTLLESGDARLEALRARVDLGEALAAAGTRAEARRTLASALATAEACGAAPLADRARRALLATGARPRRRAVDGAASLTAAERRVADLAARGRTNRQIADGLHLTGKTVENHLTSAYRKLSIASRTQLAEALREPDSAADLA